jgi:hypothetical protein
MGGRGWMIGSDCTYSPETDEALVRSVRKTVDEL